MKADFLTADDLRVVVEVLTALASMTEYAARTGNGIVSKEDAETVEHHLNWLRGRCGDKP